MEADFWGERTFKEDEVVQYISIGDLHLWMKTKDEDIWIGYRYSEIKKDLYSEQPPDDLEWSRWAAKTINTDLKVTPVFPDLPIVVFSEYPLKVLPGTSIQIYTRIPIWIRISLKKNDHVLSELPSLKLSKTWFGTPVEGELCYWATTKARRNLSRVEKKPYVVNCPIQITNKATADLDFEKFCYRVEQLKIYEYEQELWADETQITYQGEELLSDITMSGKLPKGMEKSVLLSGPRNKARRNLAIRTFYKFFDEPFTFGR